MERFWRALLSGFVESFWKAFQKLSSFPGKWKGSPKIFVEWKYLNIGELRGNLSKISGSYKGLLRSRWGSPLSITSYVGSYFILFVHEQNKSCWVVVCTINEFAENKYFSTLWHTFPCLNSNEKFKMHELISFSSILCLEITSYAISTSLIPV